MKQDEAGTVMDLSYPPQHELLTHPSEQQIPLTQGRAKASTTNGRQSHAKSGYSTLGLTWLDQERKSV